MFANGGDCQWPLLNLSPVRNDPSLGVAKIKGYRMSMHQRHPPKATALNVRAQMQELQRLRNLVRKIELSTRRELREPSRRPVHR
jgi:hypothetical protein